MKILVAIAGPLAAKEKADYVVNIAKRLGAELTILHVLVDETKLKRGKEALNLFAEAGKKARVPVNKILKKGDIISNIVKSAEKESVDLIIMGASQEKVLDEWVSAVVMRNTPIPVVVIPHEII